MRFAILGAGALGTILAAHLVRAGHEVTLLARGQRAEQLHRDGLIVNGLETLRERCHVLTDPSQLGEVDCFSVATKAIETRESLRPYTHVKVGTALSMQNGVVKDELLAEAFAPSAVLGGMADFSGELLASGEVLFTRNVGLDIGELEGGVSERAQQLATTIDAAGVRCTAVPDIRTREWSKFTAWAGLVPLAALTRLGTWRYLSDATGARLATLLVREVAQLAKALNVPLMDLSPLPAVTLSSVSEAEAIKVVQQIGARFKEQAPEHRMSTLQDIERGSRLEIEETLGYALRRGREFGIPMPTLQFSYDFLSVGRDFGSP